MENYSSMDFMCAEDQHRNHVELVGLDLLQMARALACWKNNALCSSVRNHTAR